MAVRRSHPLSDVARVAGDVLPEHLRVCVIEDWIGPDESPPAWWWSGSGIDSGDESGETSTWLGIVARRRWGAARAEWGEANGTTRAVMAATGGSRCRWRDWAAYAAARGWAPAKRMFV